MVAAHRPPAVRYKRAGAKLAAVLLAGLMGCDTRGTSNHTVARMPFYSHDVGLVLVGSNTLDAIEHEFAIANPSRTERMRLEVKTKSCSCVATVCEPASVGPNGVAKVRIGFRPTYADQIRCDRVVLSTGLVDVPEIECSLQTETVRRLAIEPSQPVSIALRRGEVRHLTVSVRTRHRLGEPEEPIEVWPEGGEIEAELREPVINRDNRIREAVAECAITIRASQSREQEKRSGRVAIRCGELSDHLQFFWETKGPIEIVPRQLVIHAAAEEDGVRTLRLSSARPFRVTAVWSSDDTLEVHEPDAASAEQQELLIRFEQRIGVTEETRRAAVLIQTDQTGNDALEVPVVIVGK